LKCPFHSHSPLASTEHTACICNSGYIGRFGACVACAAGKYSTGSAEISYDSCLDCPMHTHSPSGSDEISKCTCQPGRRRDAKSPHLLNRFLVSCANHKHIKITILTSNHKHAFVL
jgi:hypothetical protein